VLRSLLRRDVGVDAIALLSMAGALAVGQYLAGAVVAVMLSGGNALEEFAQGRARRELSQLVVRAPRSATLRHGDELATVPVESVVVGDTVVVKPGELVATDGRLISAGAVVDVSTLTGEPLPVSLARGDALRSGSSNAGPPFEFVATRPAAESAYAAIVRLVREAAARKAPFQRMADRYAAVFLPLTVTLAGAAWLLSGDPVRAVAVLVVATPCPLILAAPVAIVSGVSRAARAGIVVKGGGVIEALGATRTVLLDKTGTLTLGRPAVEYVTALNGVAEGELLRLAASLDQLSTHTLAQALVTEATERGMRLSLPQHVVEDAGSGIAGTVDGVLVAVGSHRFMGDRGIAVPELGAAAGDQARVLVAVGGSVVGAVVLIDHLREGAGDLVHRLHGAGVRQVALVSGDHVQVAEAIGAEVGVDRVYAEMSPEAKLNVVRALREHASNRPLMMVGDGVNDAPALALADVGIAIAGPGATVAAETADAVLMVDRLDRIADAVDIGRRSMGIARQSVLVGLGLSGVGMVVAAFGHLPPVAGALSQEVIDVGVILNALRALGDGRR
jgi:heavy metal translocating P-type ATPase